MTTDLEPFHYLNLLRAFMAENPETYPLSDWLASLDTFDLDFLTDSIDEHTRRGGKMPDSLFSDVLAVVVQVVASETPAPSFTCSVEQLEGYVFALGLCGAFEQMRRAGVAKILSPMMLTSDVTPKIELIHSA